MKKLTQQFTLCIMKVKSRWLVEAPKEWPSGFLTN